jgi:hypothetical protein
MSSTIYILAALILHVIQVITWKLAELRAVLQLNELVLQKLIPSDDLQRSFLAFRFTHA